MDPMHGWVAALLGILVGAGTGLTWRSAVRTPGLQLLLYPPVLYPAILAVVAMGMVVVAFVVAYEAALAGSLIVRRARHTAARRPPA
ncbi:MAG: hypothetical protein ACRDZ9_09990 [Acidimicrobiales bacterium]